MLRISRDIVFDENDAEISFVRASGPGGQNVNKLSTAAQLRYDIKRLTLPDDVAMRLTRIAGEAKPAGVPARHCSSSVTCSMMWPM